VTEPGEYRRVERTGGSATKTVKSSKDDGFSAMYPLRVWTAPKVTNVEPTLQTKEQLYFDGPKSEAQQESEDHLSHLNLEEIEGLERFEKKRISDLTTPEPTWQGLTDLQMVRMKAAADQLLTMSTGANQWPRRDFALFHVLYVTAMRVSELIELDLDQYGGRYLTNVQRKGKTVTPKIFLVKAVRGYLDDYIENERGNEPGPLFQTRTGKRFSIQQVDYVLKKLAGQANATLPPKEHIDAHPHILRHTMLRKVREEKGVEYAIEYAGHVSEKYIRRYTMPSEQETESTLEELFG